MSDVISSDEFNGLLASFNEAVNQRSVDERYRLHLSVVDTCLVLSIEGMLMDSVPDTFAAKLRAVVVRQPGQRVILDLSKVTYLSSSIMGFLHAFFTVTTEHNGRIVLVSPPEKVRKMMRITGLLEFFVVLDSLALALEYHNRVEDPSLEQHRSP